MSIQDPIADMLTRIRNAQAISKETVSMYHSKLKYAIAQVLESEGYISGIEKGTQDGHTSMTVHLKYYDGQPVIRRLEKVSKPSLRVYRAKDELPSVDNGLGIAILSTSKGVMTAHRAHQIGEGGEVLCYVS